MAKEQIEVRIFEGQNWVNARDWNKLLARFDAAIADLQRALKDVTMFEGLASKPQSERITELTTCLREIEKSPQYRHVPTWVVIKIQRVIGVC